MRGPRVADIAVGGVNLVFTLIGMGLIDFVGRRKLIIWGSFGYIASLGVVTWAFHHYGGKFDRLGGLVVLVGLLVFQASHAFSQGAVIWVFIAEVFPNAVRAKGQARGEFHPLVYGGYGELVVPDRCGTIGCLAVRVLRRYDGPATPLRVEGDARDQRGNPRRH